MFAVSSVKKRTVKSFSLCRSILNASNLQHFTCEPVVFSISHGKAAMFDIFPMKMIYKKLFFYRASYFTQRLSAENDNRHLAVLYMDVCCQNGNSVKKKKLL